MIRKIFLVALMILLFAAQNVSAQARFGVQANVEGIGWMQAVGNGEVAGTTGQAKRLEALIISFSEGIQYSAHVENIGWQGWTSSGGVAGTVGHGLRMEAIRIQLAENSRFDIYYRAHVENIGWLGWAKNGEPAGTAGAALRMEAVQIQIVKRGTNVKRGDTPAFYQKVVNAPMV